MLSLIKLAQITPLAHASLIPEGVKVKMYLLTRPAPEFYPEQISIAAGGPDTPSPARNLEPALRQHSTSELGQGIPLVQLEIWSLP